MERIIIQDRLITHPVPDEVPRIFHDSGPPEQIRLNVADPRQHRTAFVGVPVNHARSDTGRIIRGVLVIMVKQNRIPQPGKRFFPVHQNTFILIQFQRHLIPSAQTVRKFFPNLLRKKESALIRR